MKVTLCEINQDSIRMDNGGVKMVKNGNGKRSVRRQDWAAKKIRQRIDRQYIRAHREIYGVYPSISVGSLFPSDGHPPPSATKRRGIKGRLRK